MMYEYIVILINDLYAITYMYYKKSPIIAAYKSNSWVLMRQRYNIGCYPK